MVSGRDEMVDASKFIEPGDYDLGSDGNRITMVARGDVWTVPAKEGITRNLSKTAGVHERSVAWSPDGKYLSFISDATGEDEIYIQMQDGSEAPVQLTTGGDTYKYYMVWSPDSKKIAWSDKKLRLQYIDISSKKVTLVDQAKAWEHQGASWSPDSRWIAYNRVDDDFRGKVFLYSLESGQSTQVTDNWYEASRATFSPDGKYLFFVSDRDFSPTYSQVEWNHSYADMAKVYLVTLAKSTKSPLAPKNDEVKVQADEPKDVAASDDDKNKKGKKDKDAEEKEDDKKETEKKTEIDLDGIMDRVVALPVSAGNYYALSAVEGAVYYITN
jgi:tricorn protease